MSEEEREREGSRETDGPTDRETKQMELGVDLNVLHDSRGNEADTLSSFSLTSLTFKTEYLTRFVACARNHCSVDSSKFLCPHSLEQDALSCYSQISVMGKPDGYNVIFSLMLPNVSATI